MWKTLAAIVAGVVGAFAIVFVAEGIGHAIFPPPPGLDLSKPADLQALIEKLPTGAIVAVLIAWGLGAFFGSCVAVIFSRRDWTAWVVGGVMLAAAAWTMVEIPHPLWFMIATVPTTLVPAWFAGRWFSRPAVSP